MKVSDDSRTYGRRCVNRKEEAGQEGRRVRMDIYDSSLSGGEDEPLMIG